MKDHLATLWGRFVNFAFGLLYNQLAFTYDFVSHIVSMGNWRLWQQSTIAYLSEPGSVVLEIAHGTGDLQIDLFRAGYSPVGVDLSPFMGAIASRKLSRAGFAPRLLQANGNLLPFPADSIDSLVCTFPTSFIFGSRVWQEIWRILRMGGTAVIVTNGILTGSGIIPSILEWAYRITGQRQGEPEDFRLLVVSSGFQIRDVQVSLSNSEVYLMVLTKAPLPSEDLSG